MVNRRQYARRPDVHFLRFDLIPVDIELGSATSLSGKGPQFDVELVSLEVQAPALRVLLRYLGIEVGFAEVLTRLVQSTALLLDVRAQLGQTRCEEARSINLPLSVRDLRLQRRLEETSELQWKCNAGKD